MKERIMTILERTNPIPDSNDLIDSAEAQELAARRPGSIIDWRGQDREFSGDGYVIRLVEPAKWEVSLRGELLTHVRSRRSAFSIVEHHHRERLWRRDLITKAAIVSLAIVAGLTLMALELGGVGFLLLLVVIGVGFSSLVRFLAVLGRNLNDPYSRPLPWEKSNRQWRFW